MKNPKMMMGLVALLLAGAGAFASISQPQQTAFYEQTLGDKNSCTQFPEPADCEISVTADCEEFVPTLGQDRQLYGDSECQQPLEREGGF